MTTEIFGSKTYAIYQPDKDIFFTPTTWSKYKANFDKVKILKKYSPFTGRLNVKVVEKQNEFEVVVKAIDSDDWEDTFKEIAGEKIIFIPHKDRQDLFFVCRVVDFDLNWRDKMFFDGDEISLFLRQTKYKEPYEEYNGYYNFDGVADEVDTGLNELFDSTGDFTISAWVNLNGTTPTTAVSFMKAYDDASNEFEVQILASGSGYKFAINIEDNSSGTSELSYIYTANGITNTGWYHVVVSRDFTAGGSAWKMWIDGVSQTLTTYSDTITSPTLNLTDTVKLGSKSWSHLLKEVAVYQKVLSDADVAYLYSKEYSSMTDNPETSEDCVFFYRMREFNPELLGITDLTEYAKDSSLSGNNGSVTATNKSSFFNITW